ncbi:MAG: imidazoleglycerol-phosphate dehydratase HisB [Candidatus Latescibacteria bacterium]|nr:imidazoleglycerol-phosphate dehydratase HisB [Candidatus Latescibacterota bacterium]
MTEKRSATVARKTKETDISLELTLDGSGRADIHTGIGFFDHTLILLTRHGLFDLTLRCEGDLTVDAHHTVEDVGICLGKAFADALGDKTGIARYGVGYVPMDETLVRAVVDLSGRAYTVCILNIREERIGDFPTSLCAEFFRAFADNGRMNLQIDQIRGENGHHIIEATFKAVALSLREAVKRDERVVGVPSTKGML